MIRLRETPDGGEPAAAASAARSAAAPSRMRVYMPFRPLGPLHGGGGLPMMEYWRLGPGGLWPDCCRKLPRPGGGLLSPDLGCETLGLAPAHEHDATQRSEGAFKQRLRSVRWLPRNQRPAGAIPASSCATQHLQCALHRLAPAPRKPRHSRAAARRGRAPPTKAMTATLLGAGLSFCRRQASVLAGGLRHGRGEMDQPPLSSASHACERFRSRRLRSPLGGRNARAQTSSGLPASANAGPTQAVRSAAHA